MNPVCVFGVEWSCSEVKLGEFPLCWTGKEHWALNLAASCETIISEHNLDAFQLPKWILLCWQLCGCDCSCSVTHFYGAGYAVLLTCHSFLPLSLFSKQTKQKLKVDLFSSMHLGGFFYIIPGEVKTLMIQLLRGVKHLHDNWILHRDLKTSNLLLSHSGILKVRIRGKKKWGNQDKFCAAELQSYSCAQSWAQFCAMAIVALMVNEQCWKCCLFSFQVGDFGLAREYGSPLKPYTPVVVTLWYRAPELLLGAKVSSSLFLWLLEQWHCRLSVFYKSWTKCEHAWVFILIQRGKSWIFSIILPNDTAENLPSSLGTGWVGDRWVLSLGMLMWAELMDSSWTMANCHLGQLDF